MPLKGISGVSYMYEKVVVIAIRSALGRFSECKEYRSQIKTAVRATDFNVTVNAFRVTKVNGQRLFLDH